VLTCQRYCQTNSELHTRLSRALQENLELRRKLIHTENPDLELNVPYSKLTESAAAVDADGSVADAWATAPGPSPSPAADAPVGAASPPASPARGGGGRLAWGIQSLDADPPPPPEAPSARPPSPGHAPGAGPRSGGGGGAAGVGHRGAAVSSERPTAGPSGAPRDADAPGKQAKPGRVSQLPQRSTVRSLVVNGKSREVHSGAGAATLETRSRGGTAGDTVRQCQEEEGEGEREEGGDTCSGGIAGALARANEIFSRQSARRQRGGGAAGGEDPFSAPAWGAEDADPDPGEPPESPPGSAAAAATATATATTVTAKEVSDPPSRVNLHDG
jgi:hypothetical protein